MSVDIEQRLAVAAEAAREHDLCEQQHAQLSARERAAAADLDAASQQLVGEEKDVERLEHLSLTRVLAAQHGSGGRPPDPCCARQRRSIVAAGPRAAGPAQWQDRHRHAAA